MNRPDWPLTEEEKDLLDKYDSMPFGSPSFFKFWTALRKTVYAKNVAAGLSDPMDGLLQYKGNPFANLRKD